MKTYRIKLTDDLSGIYEDIAKTNHKKVEDRLSIILERVIYTMIHKPKFDKRENTDDHG